MLVLPLILVGALPDSSGGTVIGGTGRNNHQIVVTLTRMGDSVRVLTRQSN